VSYCFFGASRGACPKPAFGTPVFSFPQVVPCPSRMAPRFPRTCGTYVRENRENWISDLPVIPPPQNWTGRFSFLLRGPFCSQYYMDLLNEPVKCPNLNLFLIFLEGYSSSFDPPLLSAETVGPFTFFMGLLTTSSHESTPRFSLCLFVAG